MKYLAVCLICMSALGSATRGEKSHETPEASLESWAAAWTTGNVEQMMPFYEDSKNLVAIASSGKRYDGVLGIRNMYESAFKQAAWEKVTLEDVEIRREGEIAWAICRFQADLTANGGKLRFRSQGSFVLRQTAKTWKIAMEHFSPIAGVPRIEPRQDEKSTVIR